MGLFNRYMQKKMQQYMKEDPQAAKMMNDMVGCGSYNGSNMAQADKCYQTIKDKIGDSNFHTRQLFEENLNSGLPMSLVACYAFAVGQFLEDPDYVPYGLNSDAAYKNLQGIKLMFPEYAKFVHSKHSGTEESVVLILSGNLIGCFTDTPMF